MLLLVTLPVKAATGSIVISSDGSTGTSLLSPNGNTYTFTGDITAKIIIEKDNIVIDGAGHKLNSAGDGAGGIHMNERNNVTIKNLLITDCAIAIDSKFSNCLFENITVGYCMVGVDMYGCSNNNFKLNTFNAAVSLADGSEGNCFFENNFMINSDIRVRYGSAVGENFFDYNYYQMWNVPVPSVVTPLYNGTDVNGDGIGDTPKVVYGNIVDAHPLMNRISSEGSSLPYPSPSRTPSPTTEPQETPSPFPSSNSPTTPSSTIEPTPIATVTPTPFISSTLQPTQDPTQSFAPSPKPNLSAINLYTILMPVLIAAVLVVGSLAYVKRRRKKSE